MASPITDEIVALENALQKRDKVIGQQRELLEHARAIIAEAVTAQIWYDDGLDELFYRETLEDIDVMLAKTL